MRARSTVRTVVSKTTDEGSTPSPAANPIHQEKNMKCPNCGAQMELYHAHELKREWAITPTTITDSVVELQFHCEKCTRDYKTEAILSEKTKLLPVYWG